MANSLNRNLKVGTKVVVRGRTMVVDEMTFGAWAFTSGTALALRTEDGTPGSGERYSGFDIDAAETIKRHAKDNGWVVEGEDPT